MLHLLKSIAITQTTLSIGLVTLLTFLLLFVPNQTQAQEIQKSVNCGGDKISLNNDCAKPGASEGSTKIETLIRNIINVISAIVGAICVVMIIIGGFRYVTSGGDSNHVSGAKNTILYAVVGLIIVAFAQIIVRFVLERTVPAS